VCGKPRLAQRGIRIAARRSLRALRLTFATALPSTALTATALTSAALTTTTLAAALCASAIAATAATATTFVATAGTTRTALSFGTAVVLATAAFATAPLIAAVGLFAHGAVRIGEDEVHGAFG
jgi:hypothetical protein